MIRRATSGDSANTIVNKLYICPLSKVDAAPKSIKRSSLLGRRPL